MVREISDELAEKSHSRLVAAPEGMRPFFYRMIEKEIQNASHGLPSGIFAKVNSLVDPAVIARLYEASQAGVPVTLVVRGICCLVPGLPGISSHIRVFSIVGQLLEHSRIFRFENGGNSKLYLGSADLMPRNLDRRVELLFPVEDEDIRRRVDEAIGLFLADTVNARRSTASSSSTGWPGKLSPAGNGRRQRPALRTRDRNKTIRSDPAHIEKHGCVKGMCDDVENRIVDERRRLPGPERRDERRCQGAV